MANSVDDWRGLLERADLCFKFLQQHPAVVPIPGFRAAKEVDEIAALVCWLASEDCSFSTGAVFDISGGRATY